MSRRTPYTDAGIKRVPCARCGAPSQQQWQACADGRAYRGVCNSCDVALNKVVLRFMRIPDADAKLAAYARHVEGQG